MLEIFFGQVSEGKYDSTIKLLLSIFILIVVYVMYLRFISNALNFTVDFVAQNFFPLVGGYLVLNRKKAGLIFLAISSISFLLVAYGGMVEYPLEFYLVLIYLFPMLITIRLYFILKQQGLKNEA